jgi:Thiol-disulfide isomerase and thioredoxins
MRHLLKNSLLILTLLLLLPNASAAVQLGQTLIPFKGIDLNGRPYDLQKTIGTKPVVLVFWASWCSACKTEVPKVNQLAEQYRARGIEFLAVNVGYNDSVERARAFVRRTNMTYPTYFDGSSAITQKYRVQGVPTIIIADKLGIIRFLNYSTAGISEALLTSLLTD